MKTCGTKRNWLSWAMAGALAIPACRVVVDQPPPPPTYPYPYPTATYRATTNATSYPTRSYPTAYPATAYPAKSYPAASYPATSYPTAPYPAASYATATRPPPPSPALRPMRTADVDDAPRPPARPSPSTPSCLNAAATDVPDCALVRRPLARCDLDTTPQQRCQGYRAYFDPKVAASAISCMSSLTSRQLCEATHATDCGKIALAEACLDSSVDQLCQIAQAPCKTTASVCAALLSGLNDNGQQLVAECVAHGCEGGLDGCVDAVTSGRGSIGTPPTPGPNPTPNE
jgi:hypothetical protein